MKNKKLLFALLSILIVGFSSLLLFNKDTEGLYKSRTGTEFSQSIKDAQKWLFSIRANPDTKKIDLQEVKEAREAVKMDAANKTNNITWTALGPDNIGGRTRAFLIDKDNSDILYVGGVSGGIFKSTDKGETWVGSDNFLEQNFINVSCITQSADGDLYIGTGEYFAPHGGAADGHTGFIGGGIWRSSDAGATWNRLSSTIPLNDNSSSDAWAFITDLAADPVQEKIYAGTTNGLMMSTDNGETWSNILNQNVGGTTAWKETVGDIKVNSLGNVLVSIGGYYGNKVYYSENGDAFSFTEVSGGNLPNTSNIIRTELCWATNEMAYALVASSGGEFEGVYVTKDKGANWRKIATYSDQFNVFGSNSQGDYDNVICAFPSDPNKVLIGGVDLWMGTYVNDDTEYYWEYKSTGSSANYYSYYIHSDKHVIQFDPKNDSIVYFGSDGGLSVSVDQANTFSTMNKGLDITQFYTMDVNYQDYVMGGTQDNGTLLLNYKGNDEKHAFKVTGGDGGHCAFSRINKDVVFTSSQQGAYFRVTNGKIDYNNSGNNLLTTVLYDYMDSLISGDIGAGFTSPMLLWEKYTLDGDSIIPLDTMMFFGTESGIYMSKKVLDLQTPWVNWIRLSKGFGTVFPMAITNDGNNLFAGTNYGELYRIDSIQEIVFPYRTGDTKLDNWYAPLINNYIHKEKLIGSFTGSITSIFVDPSDSNRVLVTVGNYSNYNHVFLSEDALSANPTFTSIQSNLPKMPVYTCIIDKFHPNNFFVGTEYGVYYSSNAGSTWELANAGLPLMPVFKIVQSSTGNIFAATHGKGFYKTESFTNINESNQQVLFNSFIYPNPVKDYTNIEIKSKNSDNVNIKLYDINGRVIKSLNNNKIEIGTNNIKINTNDLKVGTYFINIEGADYSKSHKIIVL